MVGACGLACRIIHDVVRRIGRDIGITASYDRDDEFMAVVFYPPMKHERFGSHKNYLCVIGKKCGHKRLVNGSLFISLTRQRATAC